jgi:simple sugar transport system permease protein
LFDTIAFMAPLAPAALGGLVTEYVGRLNIALEGLILAGAFSYIAVGSALGSTAGFLAAMIVPLIIAYASDLYARKARADSFVVGLGINMLVPALASIISQAIFATKGVAVIEGLQSVRLFPWSRNLSFLEPVLGQRVSDYLAFIVAILISAILSVTVFGARAKAVGMNPDSLQLAGLDAGTIRGRAYAISGLACGVAGASLAASVGAWVPNMSAGRGWIALVAVYLGGKRLGGTLAASALLALLLSLATRAQALSAIPAEILMSAPYFFTAVVVVLGALSLRNRKRRV